MASKRITMAYGGKPAFSAIAWQKRLNNLKQEAPSAEELEHLGEDAAQVITEGVQVNNTAIDNSVNILQPLADVERRRRKKCQKRKKKK